MDGRCQCALINNFDGYLDLAGSKASYEILKLAPKHRIIRTLVRNFVFIICARLTSEVCVLLWKNRVRAHREVSSCGNLWKLYQRDENFGFFSRVCFFLNCTTVLCTIGGKFFNVFYRFFFLKLNWWIFDWYVSEN